MTDEGAPWGEVPGSMFDEGLGQTPNTGKDWMPSSGPIGGEPTGKDWLPSGGGSPLPGSGKDWLPGAGFDGGGTGKDWLPSGGGMSHPHPHGVDPNFRSDAQKVWDQAARASAATQATAPRQVNSGLWGVPGYKWVSKFPIQQVADPYSRIPKSLPIGGGGGQVGSSGRGYLGPHNDGLYYMPGEQAAVPYDESIARSYQEPSVPYDPNDPYYSGSYYKPGETQHTDTPRAPASPPGYAPAYNPNDSYYQNYYGPGETQHTDTPWQVTDPNHWGY